MALLSNLNLKKGVKLLGVYRIINKHQPISDPMDVNSDEEYPMLKKIENYLFDLRDKVGEGSFSRVYKGTNIHNSGTVALKKVRISDVKSKIARRLLEWEVNILREVRHPNIITCLDVHFSVNNCYIVTEYCQGGNLYDLLRKGNLLPSTIHKIIFSVSEALAYLSSLGIVHRDIKVSNIFVTGDQYKIGDFGFAIKARNNFKDVSIGSPIYMSPQGIIQNVYGPKTDVWAFGILIYELIHGTTPMEHCKSEEELRRKVLEPPPILKAIPTDLMQLMMGCLNPNEAQRYSVSDISNSPFIKRVRQELEKEKIEEKELTLTNGSTCNNSISSATSGTLFSVLDQKVALSLLNYCRFTLKVAQITKSVHPQKCLLWLTKILTRSKLARSSKGQERNLLQELKQLKEFAVKQYSHKVSQDFCLQEMINHCIRASQKDKGLSVLWGRLGKETDSLLKAIRVGSLEYFFNSSKSIQYLQQINFQ